MWFWGFVISLEMYNNSIAEKYRPEPRVELRVSDSLQGDPCIYQHTCTTPAPHTHAQYDTRVTRNPKLHNRIVYDLNSSVGRAIVRQTRVPGLDSRFWSASRSWSCSKVIL